jgi:RimJ/RimL family protein N-acetyltransferase
MTSKSVPIELRKLSADDPNDVTELQRVFESAPSYWKRIAAKEADNDGAIKTLLALPDGKGLGDKFAFGIFQPGQMIGCADLIRGYPNAETAMLGLLLISESHQNSGLGKASYQEIERYVRSWKAIRKVRIGVVAANSIVLPFWKLMGFVETGFRKPYEENGVVSETIVLEKPLL